MHRPAASVPRLFSLINAAARSASAVLHVSAALALLLFAQAASPAAAQQTTTGPSPTPSDTQAGDVRSAGERAAGGAQVDEERALDKHYYVERTIKPGASHTHRVTMTAGQVTTVVLMHWNEMGVSLRDPSGEVPRHVILTHSGEWQLWTEIHFKAERSGEHLLELRTAEGVTEAEVYRVSRHERREWGQRDEDFFAGEELFAEAERMREEAERAGGAEKQAGLERVARKYAEALARFRAVSNEQREAETLTSLGGVHISLYFLKRRSFIGAFSGLEDLEKSEGYFSQVVPLTERKDEIQRAVRAFGLYRRADRTQKRKAQRILRDVITLLDELGRQPDEMLALIGQRLKLGVPLDRRLLAYKGIFMHIGLGYVHMDLDDLPEADRILNDVLERAREFVQEELARKRLTPEQCGGDEECAGLMRAEGYALTHLANVYKRTEELQKASTYGEDGLKVFKAIRDVDGEDYAHAILSEIYWELNEESGHGRYSGRAWAQFEAIKTSVEQDKTGLRTASESANLLLRAGTYASKMGELERAAEYYERALRLLESEKAGADASPLKIFAYGRLSALYDRREQREKALEYYRKALELSEARGDRHQLADLHNDIGVAYGNLGEWRKALGHFGSALALNRASGDGARKGHTLRNLMNALKALGHPRLAIFYGKQAVNEYQKLRPTFREVDRRLHKEFVRSKEKTYRVLAELLLSQKRFASAEQVLVLLKEEEYAKFVRREGGGASSSAANTTLDTGAEAKRLAAEGDPVLEEEYRRLSDSIISIGYQYSTLLAKRPPAENESELREYLQKYEGQLSELSKQVAIADRRFQDYLERLESRLGRMTERGGTAKNIKEEALKMKGTLRELRKHGSRAALLYTFVADDKYYVMLATAGAPKTYEHSIPAVELGKKVLEFHGSLQNKEADPTELAKELYNIIIGPELARDLETARVDTLMWWMDGVLRYLPVAALVDPQGEYLVRRYRNVIFTKSSRDNLTKPDKRDRNWKGLGLGLSQPRPEDDAAALPGVIQELSGLFSGEAACAPEPRVAGMLNGRVMLDECFTKKALLAELLQGHRLIHIASHFKFNTGSDKESYLLLGDTDRNLNKLTIEEIKGLDFTGVELLTLSACDTAKGDDREDGDGDEVESFGEVAQVKGAKAVMATLWKVADESTPLLMMEFYRRYKPTDIASQGMSKAEALQRAQLALLNGEVLPGSLPRARRDITTKQSGGGDDARPGATAQGPRFNHDPTKKYAHPYYWAPFILIGNWLGDAPGGDEMLQTPLKRRELRRRHGPPRRRGVGAR
ncbi:MAG TPA: CHAT domain-containing protein [Pyrinomonadaceae bacterium]|nr:CHAT domain-containing protein [Pyrinomonadaceae bacterium]